MNLGDIKQEVGRLLNDPSNDRWSGDVITARANKIQSEVQFLTKAVKTSESYTLTQDSNILSIDLNVIDISVVRITLSNGDNFPMEGITQEELNYRYPDYQNWDSGQPRFYYLEFFPTADPRLRIYPPPDASNVVTNGITIFEVRNPTEMDSDDDVPFDDSIGLVPFHMVLVHGIVSLCWMDDGTPESLAKASYHRSNDMDRPGQFEKQIKLIKAAFDNPTDVQKRVQWKPQGGRLGRWGRPSKASPLG